MFSKDQELLSNQDPQMTAMFDKDMLELKEIIHKYGLKDKSDSLVQTNEINSNILLEHIIDLYNEHSSLPNDIIELINNNQSFRNYLDKYTRNRMESIISDQSTVVYKELYTLINLLSMGKVFDIFTNYNLYATDNIEKLFDEYEIRLVTIYENKDHNDFDLTFKSYITLIEVFNELCVINSMDIQRKKSISSIVTVINNSIKKVKTQIKLTENKQSILNRIHGEMLLYFSSVSYIDVEELSLEDITNKYQLILKHLTYGFSLMQKQGKEKDLTSEYTVIFLNKMTTLLLTLLFKFDKKEEKLFDNSHFKEMIFTYNRYSIVEFDYQRDTVKYLKQHLLNNYLIIYEKSSDNKNSTYLKIIDDFLENKEFCAFNMELLHNIILFDKHIEEDKIKKLLENLLLIPKISNDYHEFYKLRVIDIIINNYIVQNHDESTIEEVVKYIETNKTASHLITAYSKIYLSLCLYYSFKMNENADTLSKDYYAQFQSIDNDVLLKNEYEKINEQILKNFGRYHLHSMSYKFTDEELISFGQKSINEYLSSRDCKVKNEMNEQFMYLIDEIVHNKIKNYREIKSILDEFISIKIFFGLVNVEIIKKTEEYEKSIKIGYEKEIMKINDDYFIEFNYSKAYVHVFQSIYQRNVFFIKNNLSNIFNSFTKSQPSFIDPITELSNVRQMHKELSSIEGELIFIEVYLDSLVSKTKKYSYKRSNEYFKLVAKEVQALINTYRLTGPRFGIILQSKSDYKKIIKDIRNINVDFDNKTEPISCTIGVSFGEASTILDKSHYCVSSASLQKDKYFEFR